MPKINHSTTVGDNETPYVSATDIAAVTFCPHSHYLSQKKTSRIKASSRALMREGDLQHEKFNKRNVGHSTPLKATFVMLLMAAMAVGVIALILAST